MQKTRVYEVLLSASYDRILFLSARRMIIFFIFACTRFYEWRKKFSLLL